MRIFVAMVHGAAGLEDLASIPEWDISIWRVHRRTSRPAPNASS
jgi:hypothetical protein